MKTQLSKAIIRIKNLMLMAHDFRGKKFNLKKFQFFQNLEARVRLLIGKGLMS